MYARCATRLHARCQLQCAWEVLRVRRNISCCSMSCHAQTMLMLLLSMPLIADVANRTAHINLHLQAGGLLKCSCWLGRAHRLGRFMRLLMTYDL